jgi:ABC-type cobalamin/Fe3+-siderophores transport system ATPase subunit
VLGLLRELCREHQVAVVLVSHDPMAARYADRAFGLRDGKLIEHEIDRMDAPAGAGARSIAGGRSTAGG